MSQSQARLLQLYLVRHGETVSGDPIRGSLPEDRISIAIAYDPLCAIGCGHMPALGDAGFLAADFDGILKAVRGATAIGSS
jgi:hypothetical protein